MQTLNPPGDFFRALVDEHTIVLLGPGLKISLDEAGCSNRPLLGSVSMP